MKGKLTVFVTLVLSLALALPAGAEDKAKSGLFIKYKPPMMGKPGNRIGGGTRGKGAEGVVLSALVPDDIGLASTPQPALCWYVSKPMNTKIEITLNDETSIKPLLEKKLDAPGKGGTQCVKLAEYNLSLKPGTEYQWFVSVSPDPEQRSKDIISGGMLVFKAPSASQSARFASSQGLAAPVAYAEEGYWYDAMGRLSEMIKADPAEKSYRALKQQLLEQVGIKDIAEEDK